MICFILVNGRTPAIAAHCAACGAKIKIDYIHEFGTQRWYCDRACFNGHPALPPPALEYRAKAAS